MPDRNLVPHLLELIRQTGTSLPADVEFSLRQALEHETSGSPAQDTLTFILRNVKIARRKSVPICQDTGTPIFHVHYPRTLSQSGLIHQIHLAVAEATTRAYLRPNAVHPVTGINSGNNLGQDYPVIHCIETENDSLEIGLLLKGGGCENVSCQYALPDETLNAGRDLDGVRKAVLDAVYRAQGMGCAPGFLGVAIGGDRAGGHYAAKEIFMSPLGVRNPDPVLAELEERITFEANQLGIGPMGFGGHNTILDTRITALHRLPASYFVTLSYMCWAYRRRRMTISNEKVEIT